MTPKGINYPDQKIIATNVEATDPVTADPGTNYPQIQE